MKQEIDDNIFTLALLAKETSIEAAERLAKEKNIPFSREQAVDAIRVLLDEKEAEMAAIVWLDKGLDIDKRYAQFRANIEQYAHQSGKRFGDGLKHTIQRTIEALLDRPSWLQPAMNFRNEGDDTAPAHIEPGLFIDEQGLMISLGLFSDRYRMPANREAVTLVINGETVSDFEFEAQEKTLDLLVPGIGRADLQDTDNCTVHYDDAVSKITIVVGKEADSQ